MSSDVKNIIKKWLDDTTQPLILKGLGLKILPNELKKHNKKITELDISNNEISEINFTLPECIKLVCFNCKLSKLTRLGKCVYLDCSNNVLTALPTLRQCETLLCQNNNLKTIDPKKLNSLKTVAYYNNPLKKDPVFDKSVQILLDADEEESLVSDTEEDEGIESEEDDDLEDDEEEILVSDTEEGDIEKELLGEEDLELDVLVSDEEEEFGKIYDDVYEEEIEEMDEKDIAAGIKVEKAYFTITKPPSLGSLKIKRDIMNIIPKYKTVKVFGLIPIKKVFEATVSKAKQKKISEPKQPVKYEVKEIETVKQKEPESTIKIKFDLERLPPKMGNMSVNPEKTVYDTSELKHMTQQTGIEFVKYRPDIVKNLLKIYLNKAKIPPDEKQYGQNDYYTENEMKSVFKALGISKKQYQQKLNQLKRILV
jgi:hypothetical protein